MTTTVREQYVTRDLILKLLSDEEVARVSNAETRRHLVAGDEYVDLERLNQGVQRMEAPTEAMMGHVLPHSAVRDDTWVKIVEHLSHAPAAIAAK